MAEIRPFRGVHYNKQLLSNLSQIICSPYDIISPQLQQELYQRSHYNFIRLEHGREVPQDTATDNKYTRSASTLEQWLKEGVLEIDETPAIYLHDHYFTYQNMEYKRRGIIACVRLEEWDKMIIRPHEGTLAEPKSDRINLLRELKVNTSPILAMFEDQKQQISSLLAKQGLPEPLISSTDINGEKHYVWAITEPKIVNQICDSLANQPIYIADGHHRYESALAYQRERKTRSSATSENEAFNFIMMTLVDFSDPGLLILPPHRLVRGISKSILNELIDKLRTFFDIEEQPLDISTIQQQSNNLLMETNEIRLFLSGLKKDHVLNLKLRNFTTTSKMMPYFHSELYKKLDVSIIDHIILENLLELRGGKEETRIAFSYDGQDAINKVLDQEYQMVFLLSPIKAEVIKAIADASDKMPRKSTYFYPKLPSGLVIHQLT
ncbi:MAG: DUF1015 domain-containing protein [Dehalococcoidales bacterium]|nr:DUF1015 domain-containing protein [Dehalococcoidales bacterium]